MHFLAHRPNYLNTVITTDTLHKLVYEDESQSEERGALRGFKRLRSGQDAFPGGDTPHVKVRAVF